VDPSEIAVGARRPQGPIQVEDIDWGDLIAIDAYLEDFFVYDLLNVVFTFGSGAKVAIDEEVPGYIDVALHIAKLPGVSAQWSWECTRPAFHREVRPVYRNEPPT